MRAGNLDRRVDILKRSVSENLQGEGIETFDVVETVWAEMSDLRGREFFASQQVQTEVSTRFRMRYRAGVTTADRLACDGQQYDITQVAVLGRKAGLEILGAARKQA